MDELAVDNEIREMPTIERHSAIPNSRILELTGDEHLQELECRGTEIQGG